VRRYKTNHDSRQNLRILANYQTNQLNNMGWKNVDTIIEGKLYLGK